MASADQERGRWSRNWVRRFVMPAVILLVAGWLAILGVRERADQRLEVEQFAAALVGDVAAGRDPAVHFIHSDPLVADEVLESLRELLEGEPFRIIVSEGDLETDAELLQPATHTVTFERDGRALLALRVSHQGGRGRIAVIGLLRDQGTEGLRD